MWYKLALAPLQLLGAIFKNGLLKNSRKPIVNYTNTNWAVEAQNLHRGGFYIVGAVVVIACLKKQKQKTTNKQTKTGCNCLANKFKKCFPYFNRKLTNKLSNTGICKRDCPVKLNFTVCGEQTYFCTFFPSFLMKVLLQTVKIQQNTTLNLPF